MCISSLNSSMCCLQRAMNLSDAQKDSLRQCRARLMADTEAAQNRRTELWQQLGCRMIANDRRSMERLALVRAGRTTTLVPCEVSLSGRLPLSTVPSARYAMQARCRHMSSIHFA